jgi:restriction system protein
MAVPDFQSFFVPLLRRMADGAEHTLPEVREGIQRDMGLSDHDLAEKLPSGVQTKFTNRLAWASVYLAKAGALRRVRRGVFQINDRGRELLNENPQRLTIKALSKFPEFVEFHRGNSEQSRGDGEVERATETPEERLAASYQLLHASLATDLLEVVKKCSPAFFERLVVDLLVSMGYGGSIEDAGKAVGGAGDGGVDGIIKEDRLGLDVVYVQAKRWSGTVGRPVVQGFAGSLEGHRARKGVLITTSEFSQDALDYVQRIEKKIVLIDGRQLSEYMIAHDVGVTKGRSYIVKKIDNDYFEEA